VGWAPLPPEAQLGSTSRIGNWTDQQYGLGPQDYTFVPAVDFGYDQMEMYQIPEGDAAAIYADSTNVTDIYCDPETQLVICNGPDYKFMWSRTSGHLPQPLTIKRGGFTGEGENEPRISGNTVELAAPRINRAAFAPKSVRVVPDRRVISQATPAPDVAQIVPIPPAPQAPSAAMVNEPPNAAASQPVTQEHPQRLQQLQQLQQQQLQRQDQLQQQFNTEQVRQEQERQQSIIEHAREQQEQQATALRQRQEMERAAQVQVARAAQESVRQSQSGGMPAATPGR
jgi:hypothetical protein